MTKHDLLSEEEFKDYKPLQRNIDQLEDYAARRGCSPQELRLLDWGCGRGRFVLWLREHGYNAYGVDIDTEPVENGMPLMRARGYPEDTLTVLNAAGKTSFPDSSFDFVFSDNVFEHVSHIEQVAQEIGRITRKGGAGYHIYPGQWLFREGHLYMPVVHWIPQGSFRKWLIRQYVRLGIEPHWKEVEGRPLQEKVDTYYRYSVNHIFYRSYRKVGALFEDAGFKVSYTTIRNPRVKRNPLTRLMLKTSPTRRLLHHLLLTFKQIEMVTEKTA